MCLIYQTVAFLTETENAIKINNLTLWLTGYIFNASVAMSNDISCCTAAEHKCCSRLAVAYLHFYMLEFIDMGKWSANSQYVDFSASGALQRSFYR